MSIAGLVAIADRWHNGDGVFHLFDIAGYPLVALCGQQAPEPMARRVKAPRFVSVDQACTDCLVKSAARGVEWSLRDARGA